MAAVVTAGALARTAVSMLGCSRWIAHYERTDHGQTCHEEGKAFSEGRREGSPAGKGEQCQGKRRGDRRLRPEEKHQGLIGALGFGVALVSLIWLAGVNAYAQTSIPELTAPVNDFAGVIDAQSEAALDSLIRKLQEGTGDVIVVATIKTFQP
jgi:hypothetical protein